MCCRQLGRPLSTSQPIKGELSMSSFVGQQVHILHPYLFKKGHFPQEIWLKICVWNPKHLPDLNPRDGKWEIFGPKISSRVRNYIRWCLSTFSLWTPMSMDGMEERLVLIDFPIYPTPFSCDTFSPVLTTIMKYEAELGGSFLKRIKVVPSYPCKSVEGLWIVIWLVANV